MIDFNQLTEQELIYFQKYIDYMQSIEIMAETKHNMEHGIIKTLIMKTGLTQKEIAGRLEMTEATVSTSKDRPSAFMAKIERAMRGLGIEELDATEGNMRVYIKLNKQ